MLNVRTFAFRAGKLYAPALGDEDVHVWIVGLDAHAAVCTEMLAPAELARASRFRSEPARARFVQRRSALRAILSAYTRLSPASIVFAQNDYGKPAISPEKGLSFNTSHSEAVALIAVGRCGPIGVDVERLRPDAAEEGIAARFFAPNEVASLAVLDPADRVRGFFNAWTRKEAIVKALGRGLSIPLDSFEVALHPDEPPAVLDWNVPGAAAGRWQLHHLEPRRGYVGALAFSRR